MQAGPHRPGRQHHPLGWLAGGTEEVESAIYKQSLLASGLRQARGKEVIKRWAPAMNALSLLASGLKAMWRNRRVSSSLSPIFYLFLIPSGVLYQKVHRLMAEVATPEGSHPPAVTKHRRPGPKHLSYSIPTSEWPTVVQRVVEQKEPLRTVAAAYSVSHETIRRIIHHVQQ